jgi:hypothetical protein
MNKVFGEDFTTKKSHIDCSIGYILRKKCVNLDGTLKNADCSERLTKEVILHYLAYLWHNNSSMDLFSEVKSGASFKKMTVDMLEKYIDVHKPTHKSKLLNANGSLKYVTNIVLISFVNHIIRTHKNIHIPIATKVEHFEKYLDKKLKEQSARYDSLVDTITTNIKSPVIRTITTESSMSGSKDSSSSSSTPSSTATSIQVTKATLRRHKV